MIRSTEIPSIISHSHCIGPRSITCNPPSLIFSIGRTGRISRRLHAVGIIGDNQLHPRRSTTAKVAWTGEQCWNDVLVVMTDMFRYGML